MIDDDVKTQVKGLRLKVRVWYERLTPSRQASYKLAGWAVVAGFCLLFIKAVYLTFFG